MHKINVHVPVLVTLPSSIVLTSHRSASLSGWIVQVTVMLYSSLVTLGEMSAAVVLVTEEATSYDKRYTCIKCKHVVKLNAHC